MKLTDSERAMRRACVARVRRLRIAATKRANAYPDRWSEMLRVAEWLLDAEISVARARPKDRT